MYVPPSATGIDHPQAKNASPALFRGSAPAREGPFQRYEIVIILYYHDDPGKRNGGKYDSGPDTERRSTAG
jgi:hypothetical protein